MDIIEALNWRYATKTFDSEKILPDSKIQILKEAFKLTPTSYGLQPIKLYVISDKVLQEKLFEASYNQNQVKTASHLFIICIEKPINTNFIKKHFDLIKQVRGTSDEVLNPFRKFLIEDFNNKSEEKIHSWATNQGYLALGNMLTVCATEEIDACPMEGFKAEEYSKILEFDTSKVEPILVLPVGYRDKSDKFADFKKVRRPLEEVVVDL
jgi:nitroreductase